MLPSEKEFDRLFDVPTLKPPADFSDKVMRQVDNTPSAQLASRGTTSQHTQANKQLKIIALNLAKVAAFVFGIMLATAAV